MSLLRRPRFRDLGDQETGGSVMRYLRYVALLAVLMLPLAYSQAQVRVGVGFGPGYGYVAGPSVCAYGYYDYYPYACAPYGYYGPDWFVGGTFIGAGPWYHGYWGRGGWAGRHRDFDGRHRGWGRGFEGRGREFSRRGFEGRGPGFRGGNFRGGGFHDGGGFHGGSGFHGGRR
jgi:hypothetical protein